MNYRAVSLAATAALVILPTLGHAESFAKFYKSYIPKFIKAMQTGDDKFFDKMSTSDYSEDANGRKLNKAQAMVEMKQQLDATSKFDCAITPLSLTTKGNQGIAKAKMTATLILKPMQDKKIHVIHIELTETETWVKSGASWKVKSVVEQKPTKLTMDGKAIDPGALGH